MAKPARFYGEETPTGLELRGALVVQGGRAAKQQLAKLSALQQNRKTLAINLEKLTALDTTGALWLVQLQQKLAGAGTQVSWSGANPLHTALLAHITTLYNKAAKPAPRPPQPRFPVFTAVGKFSVHIVEELRAVLALLGQLTVAFGQIAVGKRPFGFNAFVRHVREAGLNAVPIVALISFLMSIVLAYQGVTQLEMFGAQQYAINLVAVSTLREMGGLLAAIMVAGRSGSSFTSEIGVMKIREEVDALTVMGLNPLDKLIIPRIAALMVALPLLTFVAFVAGILGGALVSVTSLGVGFFTYLEHFAAALYSYTHWVGMSKAPVFALFIGIISCLEGLKVSGSAESVGRQTTAAVVKGIFAVLVVDALFSVFFAKVGW